MPQKNISTTSTPTNKNQLIYLGNTKDNQAGTGIDKFSNWGNIFFHRYFNNEQPIWVCQKTTHTTYRPVNCVRLDTIIITSNNRMLDTIQKKTREKATKFT